MTDSADMAEEHAAQLEELRRRVVPKSGPQATGFCLNCEAPLKTGERWCDVSCRDDWERYAR